jgi:hypothetical protein
LRRDRSPALPAAPIQSRAAAPHSATIILQQTALFARVDSIESIAAFAGSSILNGNQSPQPKQFVLAFLSPVVNL